MNNLLAKIDTVAGELRCYKSTNPLFSGLRIVLQPSGADFEIYIAMVEVPTKECIKNFEMVKGDVITYLWGNVYDEDYLEGINGEVYGEECGIDISTENEKQSE